VDGPRDTGRHHLLFVASTGGHLAQLLALRSWWERHDRTWVTFDKADARSTLAGERVIHAFHPTTRHLGNLARNTLLARRTLDDVRPDVVLSTGAGVALPFFVLARERGIPTVYLEVYDRVDSTTLTGRLCRPFSTAFCVQWPEQVELYPGSELVGMVL
jgi:UDP-N-acetylglucosamine:LPS N-acetylglucosamine transferase